MNINGETMNKTITERLVSLSDSKYKDFASKLTPNIDVEHYIGVRVPEIRKLARELINTADISSFLLDLPHYYIEENLLHSFIISEIKDYDTCISEVEKFLPFVDNWSVCDTMRPKCFRKNREKLLQAIKNWLDSDYDYIVRFAIGMLMVHYLDDNYDVCYSDMVASVKSDEYYVNMMIAWYFATALAKQYDSAIVYLKDVRLDKWVHNKTISKAIESYRVTEEHKAYLRTLRLR